MNELERYIWKLTTAYTIGIRARETGTDPVRSLTNILKAPEEEARKAVIEYWAYRYNLL